jgi:hypothetical protein
LTGEEYVGLVADLHYRGILLLRRGGGWSFDCFFKRPGTLTKRTI